jgi:hypothetical protein
MSVLRRLSLVGFISCLGMISVGQGAFDSHQLATDIGGDFGYHDRDRTDSTYYEFTFSDGFEGWLSNDDGEVPSTWHPSTWNPFNNGPETLNWWSANPAIGGYIDHTLLYLELPAMDLSTAGTPMLTFDLYYAIEDPDGAQAPYDAWDACHVEVRQDGGEWELLEPASPAYTVENAFSFGGIFGQTATGGWAGSSDGWVEASFDLTDVISSATAIRFAMCSDDGFSFFDDPTLTGMQVDNIIVREESVYFCTNDADGNDFPGPAIHYSGAESSGDHWEVSELYHSPSYSLFCNIADQGMAIRNSVTSPWLVLPANNNLAIDFWMRCDMPDYDGNGDSSLDDYFSLEYTTNGLVFHEIFYDYYGAETGSGGWYHFTDGGGHGRSTDITFLEGSMAQFRISVLTDDNHDGGTGTGFFLDDFTISGESFLVADAGLVEFRLPYPRTVGWPISGELKIQNFGSDPMNDIDWLLYINDIETTITGTVDLAVGETASQNLVLTPDLSSLHFPEARIMVADQDENNNTLAVPSYIVREAPILELANDYAWDLTIPEFQYTTGAGEATGLSYAQSFVVPTLYEGNRFVLDSLMLRFASFNLEVEQTVPFAYEIWLDDPITGEMIFESASEYTPSFSGGDASADWVTVQIPSPEFYFFEETIFWVVVRTSEMSEADTPGELRPVPNVAVVDRSWEDATSGRIIAGGLHMLEGYQFGFHVFGNPAFVDVDEATVLPVSSRLANIWPNPFNPITHISFELVNAGNVQLSICDLLGREVAVLASGTMNAGLHEVVFNGQRLASGVFVARLMVDDRQVDASKLLLVK